jgi:hypothetical protein
MSTNSVRVGTWRYPQVQHRVNGYDPGLIPSDPSQYNYLPNTSHNVSSYQAGLLRSLHWIFCRNSLSHHPPPTIQTHFTITPVESRSSSLYRLLGCALSVEKDCTYLQEMRHYVQLPPLCSLLERLPWTPQNWALRAHIEAMRRATRIQEYEILNSGAWSFIIETFLFKG